MGVKEEHEFKALRYAERYGIIDYIVEDGFMMWTETYTNEGTFKKRIQLDTMEYSCIHISL